MNIDPSTCKPDTPYWVRVPGIDRDVIGQRADPNDTYPWKVLTGQGNGPWYSDTGVTVLRPVDESMTDWEILRSDADGQNPKHLRFAKAVLWKCSPNHLGISLGPIDVVGRALIATADRLESEHKAAQEKADADAKREALIENAAETIAHARWDKADEYVMPSARRMAHALADAGLLAGAVSDE